MTSPGLILPETVGLAPADRLDTLPPWPWGPLDTDAPRTIGWHVIAWAEGPRDWRGFPGLYDKRGLLDGWRGLTQPNGPRSGKPFRLTKRQQTFWLWFYALDDEAQWLFDSGRRRLVKGAGKSPFAGVHTLAEFVGPTRLATFRHGAPGGCEAKPVDMPLVSIVATAESQTHNTMRMVRAFAPKGSHVCEYYRIDPGKTVYYGLPERTLQVKTASVTASEGGEESFVVMDELENWKPSNSGDELAAVHDDNLAKSGARSIGTNNAWKPGIETVAELDWKAWVAQEEGKVRDEAGRILYDALISPPGVDMADPALVQETLEHLYGDCDWKKPHEPDPNHPDDLRPVPGSKPDVRSIRRRIYNLRSRPARAKRMYFNRPEVDEDAWTDPERWAMLTDTTRVVADGEEIAMFFDGSRSRDATALQGCTISDGHVFELGVWEPNPEHTTRSVVPVAKVDLAVKRAAERFKVLGFFADVNEWESFVKVHWPALFTDLVVHAVPNGKDPQPIAWDMRSGAHVYDFTVEAELVRAEIDDGDFTHDGAAATARHIANTVAVENRWGTTMGKKSPDSPDKIDAAICVTGVRMVRRRVLTERAKLPAEQDKVVRRL